jgi:hypothetical protein
MKPDAGAGEMGTPRFIIGNTITFAMDLLAVALGLAYPRMGATRPRPRRASLR